jgi:hypothetical protein
MRRLCYQEIPSKYLELVDAVLMQEESLKDEVNQTMGFCIAKWKNMRCLCQHVFKCLCVEVETVENYSLYRN